MPEATVAHDITGLQLETGQLVAFPMAQLSSLEGLGLGAVVGFTVIGGKTYVEIATDRFATGVRIEPRHLAVIGPGR